MSNYHIADQLSPVRIDDASSISYNQIIEPTEQSEQDWIHTGVDDEALRFISMGTSGPSITLIHRFPVADHAFFSMPGVVRLRLLTGCYCDGLERYGGHRKIRLEPESISLFIQLPLQWYSQGCLDKSALAHNTV